MKLWKVILTTLIIFVAGLVTGVVTSYSLLPSPQRMQAPWPLLQVEVLERMEQQLNLSPEQRGGIELILQESRQRLRELWAPIEPNVKEETRRVRERIRAELTAEQASKFDELMRQRPRRPLSEELRRGSRRRDPAPGRREAPVERPRQPEAPASTSEASPPAPSE